MFGIKIPNPFRNPLASAVGITTTLTAAPFIFGVNAAKAVAPSVLEGVTGGLGFETPSEKAAKQAQESATAEANARAALFADATGGNGLDKISQRELVGLYQSGADSSTIASYLSKAREGKGIYAVRAINQAKGEAIKKAPGRQGLLTTTGSGVRI
jgi:hypothetical protein